ncbi:MAG: inorganic diphosphatase [Verrucomicrobiae bacterium]|nr:inorganic diphosphatase [Verrucomicrobiae bacterium]
MHLIEGMKANLDRLPPFAPEEGLIHAIVETPKGSGVKYTYRPEHGLFHLKKALPMGMVFPFNFGFVPSTLAEDGDPLDVLILNDEAIPPGCLVMVKAVGVIEAEQSDGEKKNRNDRVVGAASLEGRPDGEPLDESTWREIEAFFVSYNQRAGKKFKVLGRGGAKKAAGIVRQAAKAFRKKSKSAKK